MSLHWIFKDGKFTCPNCGEVVQDPAKHPDSKCPNCGFREEANTQNVAKPPRSHICMFEHTQYTEVGLMNFIVLYDADYISEEEAQYLVSIGANSPHILLMTKDQYEIASGYSSMFNLQTKEPKE